MYISPLLFGSEHPFCVVEIMQYLLKLGVYFHNWNLPGILIKLINKKIKAADYLYPENDNVKFGGSINIYELMHKGKEGVISKGYWIEVGVHPTANVERKYFSTIKNIKDGFVKASRTGESTLYEYERIFADAQYILDNCEE